jgi:hypothetical protein
MWQLLGTVTGARSRRRHRRQVRLRVATAGDQSWRFGSAAFKVRSFQKKCVDSE